MTFEFLSATVKSGVARLTLNRSSRRNALTRELLEDFANAVRGVRADPTVRLLIVAAEGPVFCAGMDLKQMQDRAAHPHAEAEWQRDTRAYRDLLVELLALEVPTLAVVQGPALAGGLGLVLACDLVLAAEDAFFALPEPKRGITAAIVAPLLVYRIGVGAASYLLLSGKNVSAAHAMRTGLCHELAPADELPARERELAASILSGAPAALTMTKQAISLCVGTINRADSPLLEQLDEAMEISADARRTADAREGLAAFLEKRPPAWQPPSAE